MLEVESCAGGGGDFMLRESWELCWGGVGVLHGGWGWGEGGAVIQTKGDEWAPHCEGEDIAGVG